MKTTLKLILLSILIVSFSCKKKKNQSPTPPVTTEAYCIYETLPNNSLKFLKCVNTSKEAVEWVVKYRDEGKSGVVSKKKNECSEC